MIYNKEIFKRCFPFPGRYFYKNVKYIPRYFRQLRHLAKYGYDEYAVYETFDWFITTMKAILRDYQKYHVGFVVVDPSLDGEENCDLWEDQIRRMITLLDLMDEDSGVYDVYREDRSIESIEERQRKMDEAKDKFFELFSRWFYHLWD